MLGALDRPEEKSVHILGKVEEQQTVYAVITTVAKCLTGGGGAKRDDTVHHEPLPERKMEANKTLVQRRQQLIDFTGESKLKTKTVTEWGTGVQGLVEMPEEDFKRSLQKMVAVQQKRKKAEEARAKPVEKGTRIQAVFVSAKCYKDSARGLPLCSGCWAMSSETPRLWELDADGQMILQWR